MLDEFIFDDLNDASAIISNDAYRTGYYESSKSGRSDSFVKVTDADNGWTILGFNLYDITDAGAYTVDESNNWEMAYNPDFPVNRSHIYEAILNDELPQYTWVLYSVEVDVSLGKCGHVWHWFARQDEIEDNMPWILSRKEH